MPDRSCPSCGLEVAAHQTLCPSCRTPVPSEAGPVAESSDAFTFHAPPPRAGRPAPADPPADPDPARTPWVAADEATVTGPAPAAGPAAAPEATVPQAPEAEPTVVAPPAGSAWAAGPDATAVASAVPTGDWGAAPASASAGTLGVPGAPVLDERGNLPGGAVGLLGAALLAAGTFLPWMDVGGEAVSGWDASGDAKVLLGLAAAATVAAALLIGGARSLVLRLGLGLVGLVAAGLGAYEVMSVSGLEEDASLALGLPVAIGGGVALVLAGGLTRHRRFR